MAKVEIKGKEVDIDIRCVKMVKFFNSIGLDTKYSCEGHKGTINEFYHITFEDYINDEDIQNFISKFKNEKGCTSFKGRFMKWIRIVSNEFKSNWIYLARNKVLANRDYKTFISLEEYKNEID